MSSVPPDSPSSESSMATSSAGSVSALVYDADHDLEHLSVAELYAYGLELQGEKKYEAAVRVFSEVVAENSAHFEAYRARGDCHLELHNYSKAVSDLRRATELHPGAHSDQQRSVAHFYLHIYSKLESETPSRSGCAAIPTSTSDGLSLVAWQHYHRALSAYYLNQFEKAIADFSVVLCDFPDFAAGFRCRGTAYLYMGKFAEAIADLLKSSQLEASSTTFYNLALAHGNLQQFYASVKYFTQSIALNPNDAATYCNRGIAYKSLAQFECAIADFSTALSLNPDSASAYDHRAQCHAELKHFAPAVKDFGRAIKLQNSGPRFHRRANAHFSLGNAKLALADIDSAIEQTKAKAELAQLHLTRAKFQLDSDLKQAEEDLATCIAYEPNNLEAYYQRAAARHIMKDYEGAREDLARVEEMNGAESLRRDLHMHFSLF